MTVGTGPSRQSLLGVVIGSHAMTFAALAAVDVGIVPGGHLGRLGRARRRIAPARLESERVS